MMETTQAHEADELRSRHGLRALYKQEEGMPVRDLPPGVYGFTWSPSFDSTPLFAAKSYRNFEFHKLGDGSIALVGFVTAEDDGRLRSGMAGQIAVFPEPWQEAQHLVSIPLDRMAPAKRVPARENGCPLLVDLQ
jgi:hypothetical protein